MSLARTRIAMRREPTRRWPVFRIYVPCDGLHSFSTSPRPLKRLMSHQSEDRLPESASGSPSPVSARILPFERPRSELQRAIQERAQEAIDLDRDREREVKRPQPLKWLIIFVIALIPVIAIFG